MSLDSEFVKKQMFSVSTIKSFFTKAKHNLELARKNSEPEIKFHFAYLALIKIGITLIATLDYRVRSKEGHHMIIIENLAEILNNNNIQKIGNRMRQKRNGDIYGDTQITKIEADEYLKFIDIVFKKAEEYLTKQKNLF